MTCIPIWISALTRGFGWGVAPEEDYSDVSVDQKLPDARRPANVHALTECRFVRIVGSIDRSLSAEGASPPPPQALAPIIEAIGGES
jgi:hypothetical protein